MVGLNHKTAPVEIREKLSFPENKLAEYLHRLRGYGNLEGCAILSTCNRTEVYGAALDVEKGLHSIRAFLADVSGVPLSELKNYLYVHTLFDCINHLFRVASGLDSMVLGETQILGQVRVAYQRACECGATNGVLNTLFQQAIVVGKRVRTETGIDRHAVSISYAAVELARQIFGNMEGLKALVIGAGKMSELTLKHMLANGVSEVVVTNRSFERAEELAARYQAQAVPYDQLLTALADADIVITCTASPHYILHEEEVRRVMEGRETGRKLFIIDIAVPRDVDPLVGKISGVELYDIDALQYVVDRNLEERRRAAEKAEKIIEEEIEEFMKWLNSLFVIPTIVALRNKAESIKEAELRRAFNRLGNISEREKKVISSMANSIVKKLIHDPIVQLKAYANTSQGHLYTEILQNLFNLEVEGQRPKKKREKEEQQALPASIDEEEGKEKLTRELEGRGVS